MGVFSDLKPKNDVRRNPFDLSCYSTYNTKVGMILPLKFWPTLPNSEYELDLKALMRTQPLHTAAFAGFSFNYDVVWTPYNDHYSSFNQFIAQRLNAQHTTQPGISYIPQFRLDLFVAQLLTIAIYDYFCAAIPNHTEYFTKIYNDQNIQLELQPHFLHYSSHLPEESIALSAIRTLDLLEYGNYLPLLKQICNAIEVFLKPTSQGGKCTYATATDVSYPTLVKLLVFVKGNGSTSLPSFINMDLTVSQSDWLSKAWTYITSGNSGSIMKVMLNDGILAFLPESQYVDLWPVMTYNKAFWQFYRNEYYDTDFVDWTATTGGGYARGSLPYVQLFNMDDISAPISITPPSLTVLSDRLLCMFAAKPHQYKKDLFTGLLPSTQYGSVSVASADDVFMKVLGNVHSSTSTVLSDGQLYRDDQASYGRVSVPGVTVNTLVDKFKLDPTPMISVLELRRADALQRFRERMLRAGQRTKDIFEAHGWENPLSEKAFDVQFFGNFDGRLDINVVASTNDSQDVNLGQLAANGVGVIKGNKVRFKSHDFGTLLVVAYIIKDAVYDSYGIHKSHALLENFDFPYPELQNVSLAPVARENLFNNYGSNSDVLGYLPQNMAYKTSNDLVHGEFHTVPWIDPDPAIVHDVEMYSRISPMGIFSNMVTPRLDIRQAKDLSFFYIQPSCADNIFVVLANGLQESDQFFGNVFFDLKAVQPLDVIGLPI